MPAIRHVERRVSWDRHSVKIDGERLMILSGEFHPFRMPVPSLWLDVLQKIKALGLNTVSFYTHWGLLEGAPGNYRAEGPLSLEPLFDAAEKAGVYLIARPGPYINAEAAGGGFPGWLKRCKGPLRTREGKFLDKSENYMANMAKSIAAAQISRGGPVIMFQAENEYSGFGDGQDFDPVYFQQVIDQARNAGIDVPILNNDQGPGARNAPGTGVGAVDIYTHDAYFLGPEHCPTPSVWPHDRGEMPRDWGFLHESQSPLTPYAVLEYQAGCWLPWGGTNYDNCAELLGAEYASVFYKNALSCGMGILNLYMIAGGTNWGNLSFPEGYTSYDYGASIREDRRVDRHKYSELKLIANFIKVSPSYLTVKRLRASTDVYTTSTDLLVTPLIVTGSKTSGYYFVRHLDHTVTDATPYRLRVETSAGTASIPLLGGELTLNGRDSKIHVVDYDVGDFRLVYSTAEIFTWKKLHGGGRTVLLVYGGVGERHEIGLPAQGIDVEVVHQEEDGEDTAGGDDDLLTETRAALTVVNWVVSPKRRVVRAGKLEIFLLDRESAYKYWVPELSEGYTTHERIASSVIVKAGYLVRGASLEKDNELHISADFTETTDVEVMGAPQASKHLFVNGKEVPFTLDENRHHQKYGIWRTTIDYKTPSIHIPDLEKLMWSYADSLPELRADYDDSRWRAADITRSPNDRHRNATPFSLFASDYGFHTGYLVYRGRFRATGRERRFNVHTQGGHAFGSSVWLDDVHLGSWAGEASVSDNRGSYLLPELKPGKHHVLTVLVDNTGTEANIVVGADQLKTPRGILAFGFDGHQPEVHWKLTGNLGGERYADHVRGPLNEGGLYAERQGWHQPSPPISSAAEGWRSRSPVTDGVSGAGVGFFTASFKLDLPKGYDIPLYFVFGGDPKKSSEQESEAETKKKKKHGGAAGGKKYRAQLYVNGWQFGKYINHIGPQDRFPVPEGILDYRGENWVALSLWAQQDQGARLDGFRLVAEKPVMTGNLDVEVVHSPAWVKREGAY